MYSLEVDYSYLLEIRADNLEAAQKIADQENLPLYKDNKLIHIPNRKDDKHGVV